RLLAGAGVFAAAERLVELRQVDEVALSLLRETAVEEVERDDVLQELVGRLGDAQVEAVLALDRAADQELDADRGLARADGARDQDRIPPGDAAGQDVIDRIDAGHVSLTLAIVAPS